MNFLLWKISLLVVLVSLVSGCDKRPEHGGRRKKGDNGYRLVIGGEPDGYKPGSYYNCIDLYTRFKFFLVN